jgi:hypothetical protein
MLATSEPYISYPTTMMPYLYDIISHLREDLGDLRRNKTSVYTVPPRPLATCMQPCTFRGMRKIKCSIYCIGAAGVAYESRRCCTRRSKKVQCWRGKCAGKGPFQCEAAYLRVALHTEVSAHCPRLVRAAYSHRILEFLADPTPPSPSTVLHLRHGLFMRSWPV